MIDWALVLQTAVILVTVLGIGARILMRMTALETKVDTMWAWFVHRIEAMNGKP